MGFASRNGWKYEEDANPNLTTIPFISPIATKSIRLIGLRQNSLIGMNIIDCIDSCGYIDNTAG